MMQFDLADELPAIEVDPGQLEQVIMNLAVNARDAMPAGGVLSFSTAVHTIGVREAAETGDIAPGDYVVLEVSDTGSGIDPETLTRIFDPFFSTKELGKGTGLGLATAYGVVTQSGGAIRATSDVGEGTTLTLLFPVAAQKVVETEPAAAPRSQPVADTEATQTVLLVEDSPDVRRVAARVLERAGYRVHAHEDAVEALEALQEGAEVDVVLTDLVLPTISGPDLVQGIRETLPDLPIVAMSGYSEGAADRRRLPDDVEFVAKPFSPHRLVEVIRRAVEDVQ